MYKRRKKKFFIDTYNKKLVLKKKNSISSQHITISSHRKEKNKHNYITLSGPYL
jgi:hypothetical protein